MPEASCAAGTFTATPEGAHLTRAAHLKGQAVPALIRFSNGSGHPKHPDNMPGIHGMAVKFTLPDGSRTDISAQNARLFLSSNVEGFLHFVRAAEGSPASLLRFPHFVIRHPGFLRTLRANRPALRIPSSYATVSYHALHAYRWIDAEGGSRFVRYHWQPEAGSAYLSLRAARRQRRDFLIDEITKRLAQARVRFHLQVQIAGPKDSTTDPSAPWASQETVTVGTLEVRGLETERETGGDIVVFDPMRVTDGIVPSDDPILQFRTHSYSVSVEQRSGIARGPEAP
jgi:catalase